MSSDVTFTLAEAALLLPPLTEPQLRQLVRALGWQPAGRRRTGQAGRPAPVYPAADLFQLHAALLPLVRASSNHPELRAVMGLPPHAQNRDHAAFPCPEGPQ